MISSRAAGSGRSTSKAWLLPLSALGIVFGDIGTSPLYSLHVAFSMEHNAVSITPLNVYGVISMVLWTITLIVTVKYVFLLTRADNEGEGGILALVALLRRQLGTRRPALKVVMALGMIGAALFYGDAVITPAISVLSAVEGLSVVSPALADLIIPVSVVVLLLLFVFQPFGTGRVSKAFGPLMLGWFLMMAALGLPQIIRSPQILVSLSPHWALELIARQPFQAFVLLGAVVLTVTGAEALYADMGHFSRSVIKRAWLTVALPALILIYLGQGALVISQPEAVANPFFFLAPASLQLPLVIYATLATVIASQAVISGTFSMTRQAIGLGLLPRLAVKHTSRAELGQIFLPVVNWLLLAGVMALVVLFSSSARLANTYGLAVTGTLLLETTIFLVFTRLVWRWPWVRVVATAATIGLLEFLLFAANTTKIFDGGWLPLLLAAALVGLMSIWRRGSVRLAAARASLEAPLAPFLDTLPKLKISQVPGIAIFPHATADTVPLALQKCVSDFELLHQQVVIVRLVRDPVPHVRRTRRFEVKRIGPSQFCCIHVTIHVGYFDHQDIPQYLVLAGLVFPDLALDLSQAHYFISVLSLQLPTAGTFRTWCQRVFLLLEKNQAQRTDSFHLPPTRTVILGAALRLL